MVNIKAILAAIFCATAPMGTVVEATTQAEVRQSPFQLGKETVASIRTGYENGEYHPFLAEMDASYKKADLSGLIQMRSKQVPIAFQEESEQRFLDLQKERNRELFNTLSEKDDSPFAMKVRSLAANPLTPEQEKAIAKLNSFISMAPNGGANADENQLIEIDLEYEYKLLHADLPTQENSPQERKAQQIALRMEKMDKMVQASKNFQDLSLKQAVTIGADTLDARLARNLDGADLNALLKSKEKPANDTEEKVLAVLSLYQEKFSDLMKEIDQANR